jgi:pectate lyase
LSGAQGDHEDILTSMVGYAQHFGCTGGAGGPLVTVTNLNNSGAGSLRQAILDASGPTWIRFAKDLGGRITLTQKLPQHSNLTIDGRGANIELFTPNANDRIIHYTTARNLIVTHMKLDSDGAARGGQGADCFAFENSTASNPGDPNTAELFWVNHCDFARGGDGTLDIIRCEGKFTIQDCYFTNPTNPGKTYLISHGSVNTNHGWDVIDVKGTCTGTWFDDLFDRQPLITVPANYHHYMNYSRFWNANPPIHVNSRFDSSLINRAQARFENNIYDSTESPNQVAKANLQSGSVIPNPPAHGVIRESGNLFIGGAFISERERDLCFVPPYSYTLQTATTTLRDQIIANAGWQNVSFPGD